MRHLLRVLVAVALLAPGAGWAAGSCSSTVKTFNAGDSVTHTHLNDIQAKSSDNDTFPCLDDYSTTVTQMQANTDPYPSAAASLATTGAGELERLRYVLKTVFGFTQWYAHSEDVNFGSRQLAHAMGTLSTDKSIYSGTVTWSAAGVTFTALKLNVTDTASAAASKLLDLQVGGSSKANVDKSGVVTADSLKLNAATSQLVLDADGTNKGTITMATLTASRTWTFADEAITVRNFAQILLGREFFE